MKTKMYKNYSIRYHNFGGGWFAHIYRPGGTAIMSDGTIYPVAGEAADAMLARARRRVDDEEKASDAT